MSIARYIDYTLLKATGTVADVKRMCREAMQYNLLPFACTPALRCARNCWQNLSA